MRLIVNPDVQSIEELEKGRKAVPIGTIVPVKGTPYSRIKVANGWKHVKVNKNGTVTDDKGKVVATVAPDADSKVDDGSSSDSVSDDSVADEMFNNLTGDAKDKKDNNYWITKYGVDRVKRARALLGAKMKAHSAGQAKKASDPLDVAKEKLRQATQKQENAEKQLSAAHEAKQAAEKAGAGPVELNKLNTEIIHARTKLGNARAAVSDAEKQIASLTPVAAPAKKGRGRPKGSKNKSKLNSNLSGNAQTNGNGSSGNAGSVTKVTSSGAQADASKTGQGSTQSKKSMRDTYGLKQIDSKALLALQEANIRRNRLSEGQEVQYLGNYKDNAAFKGKKGKLFAIGPAGFAYVNMGAKNITAAWRDLKAVGPIKPHSIYDKLKEENVFTFNGEFSKLLADTLDQKIGRSKFTYRSLCEEFRKRGFNLLIVGGTVRDLLGGRASKDVDFIVDCTDTELHKTLEEINPEWMTRKNLVKNNHLGLRSFTDGDDTVDITPIHKYSPELQDMAKGWSLKQDGISRDLAMNSLQVNPLTGIMIDATGHGLDDIESQTIRFADPSVLPYAPTYVLRAFKFMSRGYNLPTETDKIIRNNLQYTKRLTPKRIYSFLQNQIAEKDGEKGLFKFKDLLSSYDKQLWKDHFEDSYKNLIAKYRGK